MSPTTSRAPRAGVAARLVLWLLLCGCDPAAGGHVQVAPRKLGAPPPLREGSFVRVDHARFRLDGVPFRFVGANVAATYGRDVRRDMPRLLDALRHDHIGVIRVWALGEGADDGEGWRRDYAFRLGPDRWVQRSFVHLDHLLVEAARRDIRVVLVLANRWADHGGLPAYARWAGIDPVRRNLLPSELTRVLQRERVRALYRAHVRRLVSRVNTLTGRPYRDDPTILAWELANELGANTCALGDAVVSWVAEMSALVHHLDPNHLVAAGHRGYNSALSREAWLRVHSLPGVDYADQHIYPEHVAEITDERSLGLWMDDRASLALYELGRPLVIGEVGFRRGDARFEPRAAWFDAFLASADADGVSGVVPWIYRPGLADDNPHGIWPWGPRAEESEPVRGILKYWATRWELEPETDDGTRLRSDARAAPHFPTNLHRIAPYTEGTWQEGPQGEARFALDPWAVAQACTRGDDAWVEYAVLVPSPAVPARISIRRLGPRGRPARLRVRVLLDGVPIGTWRGALGYRSVGREGLARAFAGGRSVKWLRLEAQGAAGAALLRRFTTELPGPDRIVVRVRW